MTNTDRELLEWAAKACGYTIHENGKDINGDTWYWCEQISDCWSPLTDDGDALRLAVKLELDIVHLSTFVQAGVDCDGTSSELYNGDPYAATRRAIVRAAAEIGKAMSLE